MSRNHLGCLPKDVLTIYSGDGEGDCEYSNVQVSQLVDAYLVMGLGLSN